MADLNAIVVELGDRSFIRLSSYGWGGCEVDKCAANGVFPLAQAPGDNSFLVYEGRVETLEKITPPRRIVTKYQLRDDLRGSPKPETVSVDQYNALPDGDQSLYRAIHEDIPQQAEPIPFQRQVGAGEPSKLPQGVVSIDPTYYARFPAFWHLGPVRATARYVLWRTAKRIDEVVRENPLIKWSSGWGRDLDEYLTSQHRDTFFIEISDMSVNGIEVTPKNRITSWTTDTKDSRVGRRHVIKAVDGANLADLEAKVASYVEQLTEQARNWVSPDRCPCCQRRFAKPKVPA